MGNILDEFRTRRSLVTNMNYQESRSRISGFLDWLDSNEITTVILSEIEDTPKVVELLKKSSFHTPPVVSNPEDVVQIGLYFMQQVKSGKEVWGLSHTYDIQPSFSTTKVQYLEDEVINRYIEPAIEYIQDKLFEKIQAPDNLSSYTKPVVNILSGDFRGAILNINSTLTKSSQIIENIHDADENAKEELVKLLEELKRVLSDISQDQADSAEAVAWAAETLVEAKTSEKTNPIKIEITKDGLRKAASNIAATMPTVLLIAEKIIAVIDKF